MNKEKIKQRMLKSATQLWGVQQNDIAAFDPIVNLLLGACSVELERIYNDINSSNSRVLERLSKLLLPEVNKNTLPAHGILYAKPYDAAVEINKYYQFFYSKKIPAKDSSVRENTKDIFFSPVASSRLINGSLKYLATNTGLYNVSNILYKEKLAKCQGGKINTRFVWLGLELNEPLAGIDQVSLYFDWINSPMKEKYLDYLPFTKWYFQNEAINSSTGLTNTATGTTEKILNYGDEFVNIQNVISYYQKRFVSVPLNQAPFKAKKPLERYPAEFSYLFEPSVLEQLPEPYLWVKILFPPFVPDDVIDQLTCQINCFPVINRRLNEITFRLHESFNIIPLKDRNDDASFFSMESVKSSDGKPYISTNIADLNQLNNGSYIIRKGGIQRFDQRTAREYLSYMIDLLRDESASFSVYGQEMLSSYLKDLNQTLASIEQKIPRNTTEEYTIDYLILKSFLNEDNVHIEYWSTAGEAANNIRLGTNLNVYYGDDIEAPSVTLISETAGGRNELTSSEMLSSFKKALGSRERIVTIADIRNHCFSELGSLIKDVRVKKDYIVDSKSKTGFQRVIKIDLVPVNLNVFEEEEWNMHKLKLESQIQNSSFAGIPVSVNILK